MTPFLERLAARSLEAMPVLQPRRASRFEPTELSGTSDPDPGLTAQPVIQVAAPSQTPQAPVAAPVPSHKTADPLPARRQGPLNLAEPLSAPPPRAAAGPPDQEVPRESAPLLVPSEPSILIQMAQVPASPVEPRRAPHRVNNPVRDPLPLLVNAPPVPLPAEPRSLRPREGHASSPRPDSRQEQREDIHISIGRIEIRAVPPKADPPSRRTSQATPSPLDTYLQRRNGRGTP